MVFLSLYFVWPWYPKTEKGRGQHISIKTTEKKRLFQQERSCTWTTYENHIQGMIEQVTQEMQMT